VVGDKRENKKYNEGSIKTKAIRQRLILELPTRNHSCVTIIAINVARIDIVVTITNGAVQSVLPSLPSGLPRDVVTQFDPVLLSSPWAFPSFGCPSLVEATSFESSICSAL